MSPSSSSPVPYRLEFPPELPISGRAQEIVDTIAAHQVVILAGETGSGKTTQIPKMCLAAGRGTQGRIACTQPRRMAALSISRRVAEELNVPWGGLVGSKIRFDDQTSRDTVIKFLTDGMLLAEVQGDPMLRAYDTVILDEAHERSLNIDFLLGHLRTLRYKRPELKIIITSATIDTEAFSQAFDGAPVIQVSGRTFPVEVIYQPLDAFGRDYNDPGDTEADAAAEASAKAEALHYIDGAVEAVERIIHESDTGDILIFMPAERDIRETREILDGRRLRNCEVVPLFGRLSNAEQQRVFAPSPRRKLIVATNIAETSLTIPGIRFVVDTGLARISRYSPQGRTRRLPIEPIAQSSADQRKGRAGRVAEGVCIRLYSEKDFNERPRFTQPEIQRANLADVILRMKAFGLGDIERFPFINMPAAKSIRAGYALLEEIGALAEVRASRGHAAPESAPATPAGTPAGVAALDFDPRQLTPLGRELARLPVDPTVGRMILQARAEKAVREVAIIAAGLSIQDPRERPLEAKEKADAAHRRFAHPDSDFLTLLNVWDAFHDEFETMSQARLRRFCKDHFLSYTRMREWRDIHSQLLDTLEERREFKRTSVFDGVTATTDAEPAGPNARTAFGTPAYRAIHRSILSGLLGNLAQRDDEGGGYKATHDRRVVLFPGSALFTREDPKKGRHGAESGARSAPKKESKAPRWLVAAEIMETSRLYARTCARLDPLWALDLGAHVVRVAHSEPFWNVDQGRVLVKQRTRLYGLELESRAVSYGRIDPVHATEIFIREGLVNDTLTWPFEFLAHNRAVREKVEHLLTRTRDAGYMNLDEAIYRFYARRLLPGRLENDQPTPDAQHPTPDTEAAADGSAGISAVAELVALVRARAADDPRFLRMEPDDLRDPAEVAPDPASFPAALPLNQSVLPLHYAYKPGQADDGVTLEVGVREAEALTPAALDWAVPGHLEAKVEHYLRGVPKELRRVFVPLNETARDLAKAAAQHARLTARRDTLPQTLAQLIRERFRVAVDPVVWADKLLPDHLRVRVRVIDAEGGELAASRDLAELHAALATRHREASAAVAREEPEAWRRARAKWEKPPQATWTFGDLPRRVPVTEQAGVPVFAFPGLALAAAAPGTSAAPAGAHPEGVALRLFKTPEEALTATRPALAVFLELQLRYELAWMQKDLKTLRELGALTATLAPLEALQEQAYQMLRRWLTDPARVLPADASAPAAPSAPQGPSAPPAPFIAAAAITTAAERAKVDVRGLLPRLVDVLREILTPRQSLLVHPQAYAGLDKELLALVPADFLRTTPYAQLAHLPRYLKGMKLRADRWRQNPAKDAERAKQLAPYVAAIPQVRAREGGEAYRWLVEEFRVSLFAQELGTAEPVSPVKLDRVLGEVRGSAPKGVATKSTEPAAIVVTPLPGAAEKKKPPMKTFGSLDALFKR